MPTKDDTQAAPVGVSYRVLPKGDGKIYTGADGRDADGKTVFLTYARGDVVEGAPAQAAAELEERGWVEILG